MSRFFIFSNQTNTTDYNSVFYIHIFSHWSIEYAAIYAVLDISALRSKVSALRSKVSALRNKVFSLRSNVSSLRSNVSALRSNVSSLWSKVSSLRSNISSLRRKVSALWRNHFIFRQTVRSASHLMHCSVRAP